MSSAFQVKNQAFQMSYTPIQKANFLYIVFNFNRYKALKIRNSKLIFRQFFEYKKSENEFSTKSLNN